MDKAQLTFQVHVLLVDSDPRRQKLLAGGLENSGYRTSQALSVDDAWEELTKEFFQVVIAEATLPDGDGWEFLEEVAQEFPHIRRLLVGEEVSELRTNPRAERGAFVPPHRIEAGVQLAQKLLRSDREKRSHERAENDLLVKVLQQALAYNEAVTRTQSPVVAAYSGRLAEAMGLDSRTVERLQQVAALHDIGQIGVSEHLLSKEEPLSRAERLQVQTHAATGYQILRQFSFLRDSAQIVLFHHERYDGNGYPLGLSGDTIPLEARILAVADAFASMTANRPHREALSLEEAREQIAAGSGTQFDPAVVSEFMSIPTKEWRKLARNYVLQPADRPAVNLLTPSKSALIS